MPAAAVAPARRWDRITSWTWNRVRHVAALAGVVAVLAAYFMVSAERPKSGWPANDLPRRMDAGLPVADRVTVSFRLPLTPTADPRVWTYHPGFPVRAIPATYEIHFDDPVGGVPAIPAVVTGEPEWRPHAKPMLRRSTGLVVLRRATLAPPQPAAPASRP